MDTEASIGELSREIITVDAPLQLTELYDKKFKTAFLLTMRNPANQGLLTPHLFYDLHHQGRLAQSNLEYDPVQILSGGSAWERHTNDGPTYSMMDDEQSVIKSAIEHGLVALLPRSIKFVSYGGGTAFDKKEFRIVNAAIEDLNRQTHSFCAVDILNRFAMSGALAAQHRFGIKSNGVIGDFLYNGRLAIADTKGTPVVMIFGGSFENTPATAANPNPADTSAIAWAKMNIQHGLGSVVIKTYDTDQDPVRQETAYQASKNFEAFTLSGFARAVQLNIISDPDYDILKNWRLRTEFDTALSAVKLMSECKTDHAMPTCAGPIEFKAGDTPDRRVITLAHKWSDAVHVRNAERAGFEIKKIFSVDGNYKHLMVAEAIRQPDSDLLDAIRMQQQPRPELI